MYATGFGVTNPGAPNGQLLTQALPLIILPDIVIERQVAKVGLSGNSETQLGAFIPISQ